MTRRKNHRRTRRKQDVREAIEQSSRDPNSSSRLNKSDASIDNDDLDSTLETCIDSPDPNLRTPEAVMCTSQQPIDPLDYKDLSPKLGARMPKIKLDLDIPECDAEQILEIEPSAKLDDLNLEKVESDKQSPKDTFPKLESVQVESVETKLDDYLLDKTLSVDNTMKIELGSNLNAEWNEKCYNTADNLQRYQTPATTFDTANRTDSLSDEKKYSESQMNDSINRRFTFEGMQMQKYPATDGIFFTDDANWYEKSKIFPSLEQLNILKTVSEPAPRRGQEYIDQENNSQNMDNQFVQPELGFSGNRDTCYQTNDESNSSRSSSPPAKRSRTALRFENEAQPRRITSITNPSTFNFLNKGKISSIDDDSEYATALKTRWPSSSGSPASVELPTVSDLDAKVSGSELESQVLSCERPHPECIHCIQMSQPGVVRVHFLAIPFVRITQFCSWLAKKIVQLLRKGNTWFRGSMTINVHRSTEYPDASVLVNELAQLVTTIRCDNELTVSMLSEKVTHLSEELVQVRVQSEAALANLTTEVTGMREINNILEGQLKSLHNALDNIQTKPSLPPPPPPPPPPPALPTTPNSSRSVRTPSRIQNRCSTPLQQSRPSITVEDLLKVTLKKAPRSFKENKSNTSGVPKGPTVSLDMLRSVKLRSARRRSIDHNSRSPRSASMSMRSRPPPSLSLSPITSGRESSLSKILRQVDVNRRGSKRALSSPTHSETELTKDSPRTFSIARHSRSHTVML